MNARLEIASGTVATISLPRPFGALILKAAAYTTDSRDRKRHLFDAAALLACIDDPFAERAEFSGSDRRRIAILVAHSTPPTRPGGLCPGTTAPQAQLTLDLLANPEPDSATGSPTQAPT